MQRRLDALYIDRLDGKIENVFYERMLDEWRGERDRCLGLMERQREADDFYLDDGVDLLKLASDAHRLFQIQGPEQKTRLLNLLLSNSSWGHGQLNAAFRQPFDVLQKSNAAWRIKKAAGHEPNGFFDEWLPFVKAYRALCRLPDMDFRYLLKDARCFRHREQDHHTDCHWH